MMDEVAFEQVSSKYFSFHFQFSFHQMLHINHSIVNAVYFRYESKPKYKLKMMMFIVVSLSPSSQIQGYYNALIRQQQLPSKSFPIDQSPPYLTLCSLDYGSILKYPPALEIISQR
jgi:hypothetical protein